MSTLYLGSQLVCPVISIGGGGSSELPSYQVENGVAKRKSSVLNGTEFNNITSVYDRGLYRAFCNGSFAETWATGLQGDLDLSSITSIGFLGMSEAFYKNENITSVDLSGLTSIGSSGLKDAFPYCFDLSEIDLSSLQTIGSSGLKNALQYCTSLTTINFSSLTSIGSSGCEWCWEHCINLSTVRFTSLSSIGSYGLSGAFYECYNIEHIYFNALTTSSFGADTDQFEYMMYDTDADKTHTIHFPSNLQSTISGLDGYPLFGGTSGYVVLSFDLPATS